MKRLHQLAIALGNNPRKALNRLIQGALLFSFGMLIIVVSDRTLPDSMVQELLALAGLVLASIGILWALVGYLSMSVLRLYHMLNKKD